MEYDGEIVWRFDAIHGTIGSRLGAANLALKQGIESPLYIPRSQRPTIVESYAMMQVKNISERIRHLPAFRQARLNIQVLIASKQRIKEKLADALRLRVETHSRVEIRGAALDDHDQRLGIGGVRTGEKRQQ
jgi:hypothetical protein